MKITKITPIVSMPINGLPWLFVKVDTDEGYFGIGECTDYYVNGHLVRGINAIESMLLGMDATNIENIWQTIEVENTSEDLLPFLITVPLQKLAYYSALKKGYDIDKPRNLAKSVTVE